MALLAVMMNFILWYMFHPSGVACSRDLQNSCVGNSKNRKKIEAENPLQKWQIWRRFRLDFFSILKDRRTDEQESKKNRSKICLDTEYHTYQPNLLIFFDDYRTIITMVLSLSSSASRSKLPMVGTIQILTSSIVVVVRRLKTRQDILLMS
jgi:hypothetical protein